MTNHMKDAPVERLDDTSGAVQDKLHQAGEAVRKGLRTQVDDGSDWVGDQVSEAGRALHRKGKDLGAEGQEIPARVVHNTADRVDDVAGYLHRSNSDRILSDLGGFLRKPLVIALAGVVVGMALSRRLRSASSEAP
jgi:hypothetical protein